MQKHVKNYFDHFQLHEWEIFCEVCGALACDIHHIKFRSQGGGDEVENNIALCRVCHDMAHAHTIHREELFKIHNQKLNHGNNNV